MCQFLVKVKDNHRPGQTNPQMVSRPGDPIVCMPDEHIWGRKETWPNFFIIKIADKHHDEMKRFCETENHIAYLTVKDPLTGNPLQVPYRNVTHKRCWSFNMKALEAKAKKNNGLVCIGKEPECDFTWEQFQHFIIHKPKNKTLPELER